MKILVIGGNRFFGKRLVHLLIKSKHEITILNRGNLADDFEGSVQRIICDRTNAAELKKQVGDTRWDIVYDQVCYDDKTAREACKIFLGKTRKYIFTSSVSVYPLGSGIKESGFDPLTYKYKKSVLSKEDYAEAKRQAEVEFFKNKDMSVVAVRLPIVLGPDDYTERLKFHIEKIKNHKGIYFPNPKARISFVSSQDAALFLKHLINVDFKGAINCASPDAIELQEVVKIIENTTNRKAQLDDKVIQDNQSPFGISNDWCVDVSLMKNLGFQTKPLLDWLPQLIENIS